MLFYFLVIILENSNSVFSGLVKNHSSSPGDFELVWNGRDEKNLPVGSGVYFYQLNINGNSEGINKMILMK